MKCKKLTHKLRRIYCVVRLALRSFWNCISYRAVSYTHLKKGYREEKGVAPDSRTETYIAMKLGISNWRWSGVPFYIRTGKQMPTKVTEIVVHFRETPHQMFHCAGGNCPRANKLILRLQPNEGIVLKIGMKVPGAGFEVRQVTMDFSYAQLGGVPSGCLLYTSGEVERHSLHHHQCQCAGYDFQCAAR